MKYILFILFSDDILRLYLDILLCLILRRFMENKTNTFLRGNKKRNKNSLKKDLIILFEEAQNTNKVTLKCV